MYFNFGYPSATDMTMTGQEFGYLANLYLYNRKLTATEITQNYTSLVGRFV